MSKFQLPDFKRAHSKGRLMRVFFGADLRSGHDGLFKQAAKEGYNIDNLGAGEYVCFVNNSKKGVKLFASGRNMLGYFRLGVGEGMINLRVLSLLPQYFTGGQLQYTDALREVITKEIHQ